MKSAQLLIAALAFCQTAVATVTAIQFPTKVPPAPHSSSLSLEALAVTSVVPPAPQAVPQPNQTPAAAPAFAAPIGATPVPVAPPVTLTPAPPPAITPVPLPTQAWQPSPALAPLAEFVRELRGDASFGPVNPHDWEVTLLDIQNAASAGDIRADAALLDVPAYLYFQSTLGNRRDLTDAEALMLYQLSIPIFRVKMPVDLAPLSEVQALAVQLYTGTTYLTMNVDIHAHRGKAKDLAIYTATLDGALSKLPLYDGEVFHVQEVPMEVITSQHVGTVQKYWEFLSTSIDKIGWQGNLRMVIHTHTGRDISKWSINPQEHEILIPRNVPFRVIKNPVLDPQTGVYTIEYDEIVPPGR